VGDVGGDVEIFRHHVAAFNDGDLDAMADLTTEDFEKGATVPAPSLGAVAEVALTDSQRDQLRAFLEKQGASEDQIKLQPSQTLPENYIEAILLEVDGEDHCGDSADSLPRSPPLLRYSDARAWRLSLRCLGSAAPLRRRGSSDGPLRPPLKGRGTGATTGTLAGVG
jgi:hypothetical protein